jgi:hypothetical protein
VKWLGSLRGISVVIIRCQHAGVMLFGGEGLRHMNSTDMVYIPTICSLSIRPFNQNQIDLSVRVLSSNAIILTHSFASATLQGSYVFDCTFGSSLGVCCSVRM